MIPLAAFEEIIDGRLWLRTWSVAGSVRHVRRRGRPRRPGRRRLGQSRQARSALKARRRRGTGWEGCQGRREPSHIGARCGLARCCRYGTRGRGCALRTIGSSPGSTRDHDPFGQGISPAPRLYVMTRQIKYSKIVGAVGFEPTNPSLVRRHQLTMKSSSQNRLHVLDLRKPSLENVLGCPGECARWFPQVVPGPPGIGACRYRPRMSVTAAAGMTVLLLGAAITRRRPSP